jgi:glutamate N-acetyltransferase/amino-acid N-acetyltransferase
MSVTGSSFFASRWVEAPPHAIEASDGLLPLGFRAAGLHAGIKAGGVPDIGMIVSGATATTSAARFTNTGAQGAPVLLTRQQSQTSALRAVVANSGNANAATGEQGLLDAARMRAAAAELAGVEPELVAVASTGVIGVPLPMDVIEHGIRKLGPQLRRDGAEDFAAAIRTTDAFPKQVLLDVELSAGSVRLAVEAKGAGMISPHFATLLVFVQTDAVLDADEAALLLKVATQRSFNRISVDGQLSTSDTIVLQCSGVSGIKVEEHTDDERVFGEALDAALRQISLLVARDGEGARRTARVRVHGPNEQAVARVAHAVGDSQLVKTALYGGDPNWGRIIQAVGAALPGTAPLDVAIEIEGIRVCEHGGFVKHDAHSLEKAVQRDEVEYEIWLPGDGEVEFDRYFSDLGHEYITTNADYTT